MSSVEVNDYDMDCQALCAMKKVLPAPGFRVFLQQLRSSSDPGTAITNINRIKIAYYFQAASGFHRMNQIRK